MIVVRRFLEGVFHRRVDLQSQGRRASFSDSRELHSFLEVRRDFSTWVKDQIERARLVEGREFVTESLLPEKGEQRGRGGHNRLDYHLTIDAAKHVAMMSGTDRGFQVREYFIECERRSKAMEDPRQLLRDPAAMRALLLSYTEEVIELRDQVKELEPKADALHRIAEADGSLCITDAAKTLQMRPKDLFEYLRQNGWIYRRPGTAHDIGYQSKLIAGLLEHKVTTVLRADGSEKVVEQVRVTPKGLTKLAQIIKPGDRAQEVA